RTKDLLLDDLGILPRRDQGRLVEEAGALRLAPAGYHRRAVGLCTLHEARDAVALPLCDERAELGSRLVRSAVGDGADGLAQVGDEPVIDPRGRIDMARRCAVLTGIVEARLLERLDQGG